MVFEIYKITEVFGYGGSKTLNIAPGRSAPRFIGSTIALTILTRFQLVSSVGRMLE